MAPDQRRTLTTPLGEFLDAVAERTPAPGGGAVCAVAVGLAAGLVAMAARFSTGSLADALDVADAAEELRARVAPLADDDAAAYGAVLAAYALPRERPDRREAVRRSLSGAAAVPLQIAEIGAAVVQLAQRLEREGNPHLRGDAAAARLVAAGAVRAAATLVELNLAPTPDERRDRARALAETARSDS